MARKKSSGDRKFGQFRKNFSYFRYVDFTVNIRNDAIYVEYLFDLAGKYSFRPSFSIPHRMMYGKKFSQDIAVHPVFRQIVFSIGMIELISYWKTACPRRVIISPFSLSEKQLQFWKKVYYHGLGEFFHSNDITVDQDEFMTLEPEGKDSELAEITLEEKILVPVGGGKDSIVTLEMLRHKYPVRPLIMNPRGATLETTRIAGYGRNEIAEINRNLDPLLLRLNDEGFLNGHTPFSALLGFYTLLLSFLTGYRHIALSNESSANEPTIPGTKINHQYSKSFEFEKDFRAYVHEFISPGINYFSFLRPLNELQIARLFSENVRYFEAFKSCNVGSKTDSWCGKCPKCLFAWTILSPFIPLNELIHIFGKNLYEDPDLIPYLKELTGIADQKPFECVGTIDEVNAALSMFMRTYKHQKFPLLVDYYSNSVRASEWTVAKSQSLLSEMNHNHFLLPEFLQILNGNLTWKN